MSSTKRVFIQSGGLVPNKRSVTNDSAEQRLVALQVQVKQAWWLVDLQAIPEPTFGATRLVRSCMQTLGWDEAYARRVLEAYRQFLHVKKAKEDWNAQLLSPSIDVDRMWQVHILDVSRYVSDCELLCCGNLLSRRPEVVHNPHHLGMRRLLASREALLDHFGDAVDQSVDGVWKEVFHGPHVDWVFNMNSNSSVVVAPPNQPNGDSKVTLYVVNMSGHTMHYKVKMTTKMSHLFHVYADKMGRRQESLLFFHSNFQQVNADDTPESLNLADGSEILCLRF